MNRWDFQTALGSLDKKYAKTLDLFLKEEPLWRCVMKKSVKFAVTAAAAVVTVGVIAIAMFLQNRPATVGNVGSPGKESGQKLRICFDLGSSWDERNGGRQQEEAVKSFLGSLRSYGEDNGIPSLEDVEAEVIPGDGQRTAERSAVLQRIRTEVMTGGGPDVFVCLTEGAELNLVEGGRLFPYIRKAMEDGVFLPLDDYLEQSQIAEREELVTQVLTGGKNENGQQMVIPLCYSIPSIFYEQPPEESLSGLSWQDVLSGETALLSDQLRWFWPIGTFSPDSLQKDSHTTGFPYIYPDCTDNKAGALRMTEEELLSVVKENLSAYQADKKERQEPPAASWALFPSRMIYEGSVFFNVNNPGLSVVPMRNEKGGATAVVSMYCAVNSNAQNRDAAFSVLNYLLSKDCQERQEATIYRTVDYASGPSMLINKAACESQMRWTEETLATWNEACAQVNAVYFPSPVDTEFNNMLTEIETVMRDNYNEDARMDEFVYGSITEEELQSIVREYYEKIQRLLDES